MLGLYTSCCSTSAVTFRDAGTGEGAQRFIVRWLPPLPAFCLLVLASSDDRCPYLYFIRTCEMSIFGSVIPFAFSSWKSFIRTMLSHHLFGFPEIQFDRKSRTSAFLSFVNFQNNELAP